MVRKHRRWALAFACLPALLVAPPAVAATGSGAGPASGTVVQVATDVGDVPDDPEDSNGAPEDPVGAAQTTVPDVGATQVSGTIVHVDLGESGTAVLVQTGTELVRVEGDGVEDLEPDTRVNLTVTADASRADAVEVVDTLVQAPVADATTTAHHVKVALVAPEGTVPADFTAADVPGMVKGASDYWSRQTDGQVSFSLDSVADWTRSAYTCADFRSIWSEAQNTTGYRGEAGEHLLVLVPKAAYETGGCAYGKGTIGAGSSSGGMLIVADTIPALVSHELGHNLGLDHANAVYGAAPDSSSPTGGAGWAPGTTFVEYGDIQEVMGWSGPTVGTSSLNAVHRDQMGLFADEIQTVSASGVVTIEQTGAADRGTKVVKVVNGSATYYLEYRTAVGADATTFTTGYAPAEGVRVLRTDLASPAYRRSVVLDPTPTGSANDFNQVIPLGRTFDTADDQLHFTVKSTANGFATVGITYGASTAPVTAPGAPTVTEVLAPGPNSATLKWTAAGDGNGTITGYTVTPYLDGTAQAAEVQTLSSTARLTTFPSLTAGTYTFGVKAKNEKGFGVEARSPSITVARPVVVSPPPAPAPVVTTAPPTPTPAVTTAPPAPTPVVTTPAPKPPVTAPPATSTVPGLPVKNGDGSTTYTGVDGRASVVKGAIQNAYESAGASASVIGLPTGNEFAVRDGGRVQRFTGGLIYFSPSTGAQVVTGDIQRLYAAKGWENSDLAYPTSGEIRIKDGGVVQRFQGGLLYWTARTGAHEVKGAIGTLFAAQGWENSVLAYPTSDEIRVRDGGVVQRYQGGLVYFTPATGSQIVTGAIGDRYASLGWENSQLGFPTSGEVPVPGGVRQTFQRGALTFTFATGRTSPS